MSRRRIASQIIGLSTFLAGFIVLVITEWAGFDGSSLPSQDPEGTATEAPVAVPRARKPMPPMLPKPTPQAPAEPPTSLAPDDHTAANSHPSLSRAEQLEAIQADYKMALGKFNRAVRAGQLRATKEGGYRELAQLRAGIARWTRKLIDANPKDEVALDAIAFSMHELEADEADDCNLYALLSAYHLASPKIGQVTDRLHADVPFLWAVAEKSPYAEIRGGATLALAKRLAYTGRAGIAEILCEQILEDHELAKFHTGAEEFLKSIVR